MIQSGDYVIDDTNYAARCFSVLVEGHMMSTGLIPRDYAEAPVGGYEGSTVMSALNDELPLISWEEMPERIKEKVANKSQLSDIRNTGNAGKPIPSLDQNGQGYCWMYSGTSAAMLLRAVQGLPYVRLSGHAGACIIKGFRDQGGWGAQGLEFLMKRGQPSVEMWPEKSMSREHDNERTWQNAALHKIVEGFIDLDESIYDRDLTFQQVLTCLLCNIPVISDFRWWAHSVCAMDAVDVEPSRPANDPRRYGIRIWNSWRDSWGTMGTSVLTGTKAVPSGATAPRAITFSDQ
jgi:hypothetical protein